MSGSGPCGPIFHGVWQSLQPMIFTRYSPRLTGRRAACGACARARCLPTASALVENADEHGGDDQHER